MHWVQAGFLKTDADRKCHHVTMNLCGVFRSPKNTTELNWWIDKCSLLSRRGRGHAFFCDFSPFCHPFFCKMMTKGIFQALSLSPAPPSSPHFSSFILSSFHHSHFQTLCPSIVVSLLVSYLTILSLSFFTCQSPRLEVWLIMLLSFSSPLSSRDTLLKTPGLTQQDISASIFSPCLSIPCSALPLLSCFYCLIYQWSRSICSFQSFLPFPFFFHN